MRVSSLAPALVLAIALPGLARADAAMCEYRNPTHPGWDFFTSCTFTTEEAAGATTTRVEVSNGSKFTTAKVVTTEGTRYTVNGKAARPLDEGGSRCYRTEAENETICIHAADAIAPASVAPLTSETSPILSDVSFGGGQAGFCLLQSSDGAAETLIDYGACVKRENCLVSETSGKMGCLTEFNWSSGRVTEMAREQEWRTLDGATVRETENGCVLDDATGLGFCFATKAMTGADHAVLATPEN